MKKFDGLFDDDESPNRSFRSRDGTPGSGRRGFKRDFERGDSSRGGTPRDLQLMRRQSSSRDYNMQGRGGFTHKLGLSRHQSMQGVPDSSRSMMRENDSANAWKSATNEEPTDGLKRLKLQPRGQKYGTSKEENEYIRSICKRV